MANSRQDVVNTRFESIWAKANDKNYITEQVAKNSSSLAQHFVDETMPQHYAVGLSNLVDQCFAENQLTEADHTALKQASELQQRIFASMDQEKLKRIIRSINVD